MTTQPPQFRHKKNLTFKLNVKFSLFIWCRLLGHHKDFELSHLFYLDTVTHFTVICFFSLTSNLFTVNNFECVIISIYSYSLSTHVDSVQYSLVSLESASCTYWLLNTSFPVNLYYSKRKKNVVKCLLLFKYLLIN